MAILTVLDVGHGNCAVLRDGTHTTMLDAGTGSVLLEHLRSEGIDRVDLVLISHADADHVAGLIGVLVSPDITVGDVYLNSDALRDSDTWLELRHALGDARTRDGTQVMVGLTATHGPFGTGDAEIHVVAPNAVMAMSGAGGSTVDGQHITANSLSAVFRIVDSRGPQVILMGDLDATGFDQMTQQETDVTAPLLIYPHHGGRHGRPGSVGGFAEAIVRAVQPHVVVFSIGRDRHQAPRPDVVAAVRAALPSVHVACTQLSRRCSAALPAYRADYHGRIFSRGNEGRKCCAGSMRFDFRSTPFLQSPTIAAHAAFVTVAAPTALCRDKPPTS